MAGSICLIPKHKPAGDNCQRDGSPLPPTNYQNFGVASVRDNRRAKIFRACCLSVHRASSAATRALHCCRARAKLAQTFPSLDLSNAIEARARVARVTTPDSFVANALALWARTHRPRKSHHSGSSIGNMRRCSARTSCSERQSIRLDKKLGKFEELPNNILLAFFQKHLNCSCQT